MNVSPAFIEKVYAFITTSKQDGALASLDETKKQFLPDVSKYEGKVLVHFALDFYRGGSWSSLELVDKKTYKVAKRYAVEKLPKAKQKISLGEINGKHSDVYATWNEIYDWSDSDPWEIYAYLEHNSLDSHSVVGHVMELREENGSDSDSEPDAKKQKIDK